MHIDLVNAVKNIPIKTRELAILMGETERGNAYRSISAKMNTLEKSGEIIRLKRGLYVLHNAMHGFVTYQDAQRRSPYSMRLAS